VPFIGGERSRDGQRFAMKDPREICSGYNDFASAGVRGRGSIAAGARARCVACTALLAEAQDRGAHTVPRLGLGTAAHGGVTMATRGAHVHDVPHVSMFPVCSLFGLCCFDQKFSQHFAT
jgi:hypothetical protein